MKQFSLKNIIIACAALIGGIASFLPWATVSFLGVSISTNGVTETAHGWFTLIAFVAIIGVAGYLITKEEMPMWAKATISALSAVAIGFSLFNIIDVNTNSAGLASAGIGLYLVLIAGIATAALPWVPIKNMLGKK